MITTQNQDANEIMAGGRQSVRHSSKNPAFVYRPPPMTGMNKLNNFDDRFKDVLIEEQKGRLDINAKKAKKSIKHRQKAKIVEEDG